MSRFHHRIGSSHRARRVEQAGWTHDQTAARPDVRDGGRHLTARGVEHRQFARHPASRVVYLQHADDRIDAVADDQDGEHADELTPVRHVRARPEQRAQNREVHEHRRDARDHTDRVGVRDRRRQHDHDQQEKTLGRMLALFARGAIQPPQRERVKADRVRTDAQR
ncbi:MAG: hypothetical protein DMG03_15085 [Acidobacteria bacterium]|nr:MAG: hypothetical protein DMG03_15085 [Acidobacteriota bacterium]